MDLNDVFSDKPIVTVDEPEKTEPEQPTDVKAEETSEAAAPSAATEAKEPEKAAEPTKEPEKASTQRDDKGRFAKTEPAEAPIAALISERRKRQELEQEVTRLRQSAPKTDFFEDPVKATTEHVTEAVSPLHREVLDLKVQLQRMQHPDFDEVMMLVLNKAKDDPLLKHQVDSAPDPLAFIYREGKRMKELADVDGDIGKYRDKVLADASTKYAELETRFKALESENRQLKESLNKREKVPQSLNSEPSASAKDVTFTGPTPLSQVFN